MITIRFCITAATQYGQCIQLTLKSATTTATHSANQLTFESSGVWTVHIKHPPIPITYTYSLRENGNITPEPGTPRELILSPYALRGDLLVRDVWRATPDHTRDIFSTAAFSSVIFHRGRAAKPISDALDDAAASRALVLGPGAFVARFAVFVERVAPRHTVCVMGDIPALGNNDPKKAVELSDVQSPIWAASVAVPPGVRRVSFRYLVRRGEDEECVLEKGPARVLELNDSDAQFLSRRPGVAAVVFVPSEKPFAFPMKWRGAGVALPVFSIRSRDSCGVGEFNDLNKVVDFCVACGYQLLQLLPINDTCCNNDVSDSYPYSAVSSFALHPQYINVESLGNLPAKVQDEYAQEKERLNGLQQIDYVAVMKVKMRFIRHMYLLQKEDFLDSNEFTTWFKENQNWLVPYALFRFFMEVNGGSKVDEWGARSYVTPDDMEKLASPNTFHFDYLALTYFTQFHLHKQLLAASEYAAANQVVFKGDLPIGVNRNCVDTWVNPHLFRLNMQSGAPPDFFSRSGQNWSFPTYNWDAMSKDGYAWWRCRLGHMANYFHAYRIDHILGFFRIWEIPECFRTGMSGRFYPAYGISRSELESLGLWDIDRFVLPYVRDGILQQLFHGEWWKIKERFFEHLYYDRLKFKEEYNTEKKIEKALTLPKDATPAEQKYNDSVMSHMIMLLNNVCLLRDTEDEDLFHPRILLHETSSYAELPSDDWRRAFYKLHEDYMHHRQDELWRKNGMKRLPMMKAASNMLVCGEDLGMVPKCVASVMEETSILSLAVQRMPPGDEEFGNVKNYKYECVATTSSHDTSTFRGWWEEISDESRKKYWTEIMGRDKDETVPKQCTTEIVEWAIKDHLSSPAMWAIFPLQDLLGTDAKLRRANSKAEQINDPSNPNHVWSFRLHVTMEEILSRKDLTSHLRHLNISHHRGTVY